MAAKQAKPRLRRSESHYQVNNLRSAEVLANTQKNVSSVEEERNDDYQHGFGATCSNGDWLVHRRSCRNWGWPAPCRKLNGRLELMDSKCRVERILSDAQTFLTQQCVVPTELPCKCNLQVVMWQSKSKASTSPMGHGNSWKNPSFHFMDFIRATWQDYGVQHWLATAIAILTMHLYFSFSSFLFLPPPFHYS